MLAVAAADWPGSPASCFMALRQQAASVVLIAGRVATIVKIKIQGFFRDFQLPFPDPFQQCSPRLRMFMARGVVVNFDLGKRFPRPRSQQRGAYAPTHGV